MEEAVDRLKQVPLFYSLSQRQLKRLARDFRERTVKSGTTLVQEGKMSGVDFFVIVEGEASVTVDGEEIDRLGPSDHFGELGLIGEQGIRTGNRDRRWPDTVPGDRSLGLPEVRPGKRRRVVEAHAVSRRPRRRRAQAGGRGAVAGGLAGKVTTGRTGLSLS